MKLIMLASAAVLTLLGCTPSQQSVSGPPMPAFLKTTTATEITSPNEANASINEPVKNVPVSQPALAAEKPLQQLPVAPLVPNVKHPLTNEHSAPSVGAINKATPARQDIVMEEEAFEIRSNNTNDDPLPSATIPQPFGAIGADPITLIRELAGQNGFSVSAEEISDPTLVSLHLDPMPAATAIKTILRAARLSHTFQANLLSVSHKRNYTLSLPPISDGTSEATDQTFYEEIGQTLTALGASDVQANVRGRLVAFSAGPETLQSIKDFAQQLREKRVRITYDLWIAEVSTTKEKTRGIRWDQLQAKIGDLTLNFNGGQAIADGYNLVTNFSASGLDIISLAAFLEEQGKVDIVTNPTVTMLSGSSVRLDDTVTVPYLGFRPIAPSSTDNDDVTAVTTGIETREETTGIVLDVAGDYQDGLVTTQMELSLSDILGFQTFEVAGTTTQQPRTTERTIRTLISTPPGQTVVIAGIARSASSSDEQAVPLIGKWLPFLFSSEQTTKERKQLVVAIVPRITRFVQKR